MEFPTTLANRISSIAEQLRQLQLEVVPSSPPPDSGGLDPLVLPSWVPQAGNYVDLTPLITTSFKSQVIPPYTSFYSSKITDYSGFVANPYWGNLGGIVCHGGGHAATNDNSTVVFEFDTLGFKRVANPYANGSDINDQSGITDTLTGELPNGQPASCHTYDYLEIIPPQHGGAKHGSLVTVIRGALNTEGMPWSTRCGHRLDFNNINDLFLWTKFANAVNSNGGAGSAACFDPVRNRIWYTRSGSQAPTTMFWCDITTGTYGSVAIAKVNPTGGVDSAILRYNVVHDCLIWTVSPASPTPVRIAYLSCANPSAGWIVPNLSMTLPSGLKTQAPIAYVEPLDKWLMLIKGDLANIYEITIPADITQQWQVFPRLVVNGPLPSPYFPGKMWAYLPKLKILSFMKGRFTNIYGYRPYGV